MSILRVGLAETDKFAEGYEAIFGKKPAPPAPQSGEQSAAEEPKPVPEKADK